jgi:hypothetical protein
MVRIKSFDNSINLFTRTLRTSTSFSFLIELLFDNVDLYYFGSFKALEFLITFFVMYNSTFKRLDIENIINEEIILNFLKSTINNNDAYDDLKE